MAPGVCGQHDILQAMVHISARYIAPVASGSQALHRQGNLTNMLPSSRLVHRGEKISQKTKIKFTLQISVETATATRAQHKRTQGTPKKNGRAELAACMQWRSENRDKQFISCVHAGNPASRQSKVQLNETTAGATLERTQPPAANRGRAQPQSNTDSPQNAAADRKCAMKEVQGCLLTMTLGLQSLGKP